MKNMEKKQTIKEWNCDLYKELAKERATALRVILLTLIRVMPREMIIEVLKSKKIIKRDWIQKAEIYVERKQISKLKEHDLAETNKSTRDKTEVAF